MSELVFHNTLGGERQSLRPADTGHVTIYVCGPTVYVLPISAMQGPR